MYQELRGALIKENGRFRELLPSISAEADRAEYDTVKIVYYRGLVEVKRRVIVTAASIWAGNNQ